MAPGGGALVRLDRIERPRSGLGARVRGLLDVAAPLLGRRGAARTFGPQKGATDADVELLERALARLAEVALRDLGSDVAGLPGGGAGGGMGAGLKMFMDAELESGIAFIAEATGLVRRIEGADLVVTGEGRLDEGSLTQKVPAGVARYARDAGVPCVAVVGANLLSDADVAALGLDLVVSAADPKGGLADAARIEAATRDLVQRLM